MFEKFLSVNAGDFRQRYQGTYGFYSRGGKKKLVRLSSVDVDRGVVRFEDSSNAEFSLNSNASEEVGFEFISPKACWHNTKQGAYMIRRIAQRQYQRGISESNTQIISGNTMGACYINFDVLSAIFETPATIKEASEKGHSFALSDQFFIGKDRMWCFNQAIGTHTKTGNIFKVDLTDAVMWGTEVRDAFRRANLEAVVA